MPLLSVSAQGNNTEHLCLGCGNERSIPKGQWLAEGGGYFTSPPCPTCKAQETFLWHDWVYESQRTITVPVEDEPGKPRMVFDPITRKKVQVTKVETQTYFDPEHPGAEQQALVARVAQSMGLKQEKRSNGAFRYDREPKEPTKERVRAQFGKTDGPR